MNKQFLPISLEDLKRRNWQQLDIILITADAYVDHPAWGVAVIGRLLESRGYKVGIIAGPNWHDLNDFTKLGRPKLFFGITSGNVDSMIANYTANKRPRKTDDYSPGSKVGLRPDRSLIIYSNKLKEAYKGVPIVLGGIEASLRRIAHYDYWDNTVRRSVLLDAKADILVYGMAEKAILEIADNFKAGRSLETLPLILGTSVIKNDISFLENYINLPAYEEVSQNKAAFSEAFKIFYQQQNPYTAKLVVQKYANRYLIVNPPQYPLSSQELDEIYQLPYLRSSHPIYKEKIKGLETVKFSLVSHRGCCGECYFCGLYMHQGRIIQSRSKQSLIREAIGLTQDKDFRGTITDIGGPTVNLFNASCSLWAKRGYCNNRYCLVPNTCKNLAIDFKKSLDIYQAIKKIPKVKHLFIGSGFRYDLFLSKSGQDFFNQVSQYISGQMKVAPEHMSRKVLKAMNKPDSDFYQKFLEIVAKRNKNHQANKIYLVNYFISAHPGASLKEAIELYHYCLKSGMSPEQIQDFIPIPLTVSGCIYYTNKNPFTSESLYVAKNLEERLIQRALLQYRNPKNRKLVDKALGLKNY